MAKRFNSTEIWEEDWFLDMPNEYKLFWYYMLCNCDHAGLFKVNLRSFCSLLQVKIETSVILSLFNHQKVRLRVINDSLWLIEDFFVYQYGPNFNINNPLHKGILMLYNKYGVELNSIRGLKEVNLTSKKGEKEDNQGLKDKDKDKDKVNTGGYGGKQKVPEKAVKIDEKELKAVFSDGSTQSLGSDQLYLLERKELRPSHILKGSIY